MEETSQDQHQQLAEYIQQARASSMTDAEIRRELFQNGWTMPDINAALFSPRAKNEPVPPTASSQPLQQEAFQNQPQQPQRKKFPTRLTVYPLLLLLIAIAAPNVWPYVESRFGASPKADRAAVENPSRTPAATPTPSTSSGPTATPSAAPTKTDIPSRLQQFLAERDAIGAYLLRVDAFIAQFQQNADKTEADLKNKSISGLTERKKESERIVGEWKLVLPPARLAKHYGLMRGAFSDDVKFLELTIKYLQTKDTATFTQAVEFSDSTAQKLEQANTEMQRVIAEVQKEIESLSAP